MYDSKIANLKQGRNKRDKFGRISFWFVQWRKESNTSLISSKISGYLGRALISAFKLELASEVASVIDALSGVGQWQKYMVNVHRQRTANYQRLGKAVFQTDRLDCLTNRHSDIQSSVNATANWHRSVNPPSKRFPNVNIAPCALATWVFCV